MLMKIATHTFGFVIAVVFASLFAMPRLFAAPIVWSGASGPDTNWSNGNNWAGNNAPGAGDDVKFFDSLAVSVPLQPSNLVIASIGLGSTVFPNPGSANQREAGSLILAKTNFITLALTDTLANLQLAGKTNAIELSRNPGNNSGIISQLVLGRSNVFNVDSMAFGRDKASATSLGFMAFNSVFTNNNP